ncbi:hypothetical protein [Commensalibacter melissae]|uniref:hypothetical protein n=1 Tax=Commensalibacter melissae TaxID=2070537 RepID=UPI0012D93EB5|nr:hypothetical protein [Commensalibacter melissae]MUG77720.1 hypothetical protein [Commensalibacter melissae]
MYPLSFQSGLGSCQPVRLWVSAPLYWPAFCLCFFPLDLGCTLGQSCQATRDGVNGCVGAIEIVTATHDPGNRTRTANDTGMDHAAGYLVYVRRVIVSKRKKNDL